MQHNEEKLAALVEMCKQCFLNKMEYVKLTAEKEEKIRELYTTAFNLNSKLEKDSINYKRAELLLQEHYNNYKHTTLQDLQNKLNYYLNTFFKNSHNLVFKTYTAYGKTQVNLVEVNHFGEEISGLDTLLSDAEQQMFGFLLQQIILSNMDSDFLILDEAFSSFGYTEIEKVSKLVDSFENIQMLMIEHKQELFNSFQPYTIVLDRTDEKGTHVKELVNEDKLDYLFYQNIPTMEELASEVEKFC